MSIQNNNVVLKSNEGDDLTIIKKISVSLQFRAITDFLNNEKDDLINELIVFCQIPAPSYEEDLRAYYVLERKSKQGL